MRRIAVFTALPLLAAVALVGCGSNSPSASGSAAVTVTGSFGKAPVVTIPAQKAGSKLAVKTLVHGTGTTLTKTDSFVGNYAIYLWSGTTHRLLESTFKTGQPTLFTGQLLPGLETALVGQKMGSRVLAVIPPAEGFGKSGNPQAGIKATDTLVFVVDMLQDFAPRASVTGHQASAGKGLPTVSDTTGAAPTIKIPSSSPPTKLVTKVLIKGTGPAVAEGDTVVVQYTGVNWRTGKVFDASWHHGTDGEPFGFTIGASPSQVIPGWDTGLVGQTVGSRILLVIPPADGYGKSGQPQAGIKGTDTLVFVVDILGTFNGSSTASSS
jgi:FKBP-type peptidyl-prolyl cis-trans isomerase